MPAIPASENFRKRMKAARESAGLSKAELGRQLRDAGHETLSRPAVHGIEEGSRKVSLDEALAIAWILGVAPVHMLAPFESDTAPTDLGGGTLVYPTDETLEVVPSVDMQPVEARAWIRGDAVRDRGDEFPLKQWHRFYVEEVPPPWRRSHPSAPMKAGDEESWRRVYEWQQQTGKPLPRGKGRPRGFPAPIFVRFKEEE